MAVAANAAMGAASTASSPAAAPASSSATVENINATLGSMSLQSDATSTSSGATATAQATLASAHVGSRPAEEDTEQDRDKFADKALHKEQVILERKNKTKFDIFLKWLRDNGAFFPNLYFKCYAKNVRGVHAKTTIPNYQRFMQIPLKCLITDQMARNTPIGRRLQKVSSQLTVPNHCQVIVYMLMTRARGDSFFQPYYDVLPEDFNNFPIFWDHEALGWLEGSVLVQQIKDRKANIRSDYDAICHALPEFRRFSFKEFLWCRTAVGSRNFSIVVRGEKRTAMVPQADMLNHLRPRECSWTFDNAANSFVITSLTKIPKGAQVFDSYGKKCNSKFLLHYGFTIENNREADGRCMNELSLAFNINKDDDLARAKQSFLKAAKRTCRVSMWYSAQGTIDALSYLRIACATRDELRMCSRSLRRQPINAQNELRCFQTLSNMCNRQLKRYPTTMKADDDALENGGLNPFCDKRHAIIVVRGEKEICHFFINLHAKMEPLLNATATVTDRRLAIARYKSDRSDLARFICSSCNAVNCAS